MAYPKKNNRFRLTHPQMRIWQTEQRYPGTSINHICGTAETDDNFDTKIMIETLNAIVERHAALRLRFEVDHDQEVWQYVEPYVEVKIPYYDFSSDSRVCPSQSLDEIIEQESSRPFALRDKALYQFFLFRRSEGGMGFFAKFHHLVFDGWSTQLFIEEVADIYQRFTAGQPLPEIGSYMYLDYVQEETGYLASERSERDRQYWRALLATTPDLPFHKRSDSFESRRMSFTLEPDLFRGLREWLVARSLSLNDFLVGLAQMYMHKAYGESDIALGIPVYNRSGQAQKQTIGMYTSTVPLRLQGDQQWLPDEWMKKVKRALKKSYVHQKYPYDLMLSDRQTADYPGQSQIFQISINYYAFQPHCQINGHDLISYEIHNGTQLFPLELRIKHWSEEELQFELDYQLDLFSADEVEQIYHDLVKLTQQMIASSGEPVKQLTLHSQDEATQAFERLNQTETAYPADQTVDALITKQALRTPHQTAVSAGDDLWSYGRLESEASAIARLLQAKGIGRGARVAVYGERSSQLIAGILGIMKTGAAFVPLDHQHPAQRIKELIHDSEVSLVLTNQDLPEEISSQSQRIDLRQLAIAGQDHEPCQSQARPDDLAYIIYTSGSTGKPKGVMIQHRSLTDYVWWAKHAYFHLDQEIFAFYSSLAFDLTITSLFTPLISGHQIRIFAEEDHTFLLERIIDDGQSTIIKMTPSHLQLIADRLGESCIRTVIVGGEDFKTSLAKRVSERNEAIRLFNEYGPTEATVGCMIHQFDPLHDTAESVPIGLPADNMKLQLLDDEGLPVSLGRVGELHLSGAGIAKGYWKQEKATVQSFYYSEKLNLPTYRSGDLAWLDAKRGVLYYQGRCDEQMKLRGYRIEPAEIEQALSSLPGVKEAAVTVHRSNSDQLPQLWAHFQGEIALSPLEMKLELAERLPAHMIPTHVIQVLSMPLTANGKLDRKQLPYLESSVITNEHSREQAGLNAKEELLVQMLSQLLHVQLEDQDLEEHFYSLGGDSIKAIELSAKLHKAGWKLKTRELLAYGSLREVAASLMASEGAAPSVNSPAEGDIPYAPIAKWFFDHEFKEPQYWHQSILLQGSGTISHERLEAALNELKSHHDVLRLNVNMKTKTLFYNPKHIHEPFVLPVHDLSMVHPNDRSEQIRQFSMTFKQGWDLEHERLFRGCLLELGNDEYRLLIVAHHLIIDAVSWRTILDDLQFLLYREEHETLPERTDSYQAWCEEMERYRLEMPDQERAFWQELKQEAQSNKHPIFDPAGAVEKRAAIVTATMDAEDTAVLRKEANRPYRTEFSELLVAGLVLALLGWSRKSSLLLTMEGHGREAFQQELNVNRTVGWFTSLYPMYYSFDQPGALKPTAEDLQKAIEEVKARSRSVPNKGRGYLHVQDQETVKSLDSGICLNYLGELDGAMMDHTWALAPEDTGLDLGPNNRLTHGLSFTAWIQQEKLHLSLKYSPACLTTEEAKTLIHLWQSALLEIKHYCIGLGERTEWSVQDFDTLDLDLDDLNQILDST